MVEEERMKMDPGGGDGEGEDGGEDEDGGWRRG